MKLFTESSAEINYGIKSVASTKVAGMHFQHGIEFDLTSMSLDLFHTTGGYAIFWEAEKTERLMGHDEVELNIAAEVTLGGVTVAVKHKPQPNHVIGYGTSFQQSRELIAPHVRIQAEQRQKLRQMRKRQEKQKRVDEIFQQIRKLRR